MRPIRSLILFACVALSACGDGEPARSGAAEESAAPSAPIIAALAHPDRSDADREMDLRRKPDVVLEFFGVGPGMTVLDLWSGAGYYTEILARVVGATGNVWAHNNTPYLRAEDALAARYGGGRLAAVERFVAENNRLDLPASTFDAVLMILVYHDIYFVNEEIGWEKIDGPALLAEVYQAMKPGAVLGVVDHVAAAGSPPEVGNTLHRIDPDLLRREIVAAGFVFEASSDALRNPADDLSENVFADTIRGRTDRVIFRFRKP